MCIIASARSFTIGILNTIMPFPFSWAVFFHFLPSLRVFLPSSSQDCNGILNTLNPSTPSGKFSTNSAFIPDHNSFVIFLCFCFILLTGKSSSSLSLLSLLLPLSSCFCFVVKTDSSKSSSSLSLLSLLLPLSSSFLLWPLPSFSLCSLKALELSY